MRIFWIGLAAVIAWTILTGCASSIKLTEGVEVGVEAGIDKVGGTVEIEPKQAGCDFAKAISWNWLENQLCEPEAQ